MTKIRDVKVPPDPANHFYLAIFFLLPAFAMFVGVIIDTQGAPWPLWKRGLFALATLFFLALSWWQYQRWLDSDIEDL